MPKFELQSGLKRGSLSIKKKSGRELISIKRPFYKDLIKTKWFDKRYTITRSGLMRTNARIEKDEKKIGEVNEKVSLETIFKVKQEEKEIFEIKGKGILFNQGLSIKKDGEVIGEITPIGFYVPLISTLKGGVRGKYKKIPENEEELLLMSIIAISV